MNLSVSDWMENFWLFPNLPFMPTLPAGIDLPLSMLPNPPRQKYLHFVSRLKEKGAKVETGSFGEYMEISSELDGPVTIVLET